MKKMPILPFGRRKEHFIYQGLLVKQTLLPDAAQQSKTFEVTMTLMFESIRISGTISLRVKSAAL